MMNREPLDGIQKLDEPESRLPHHHDFWTNLLQS